MRGLQSLTLSLVTPDALHRVIYTFEWLESVLFHQLSQPSHNGDAYRHQKVAFWIRDIISKCDPLKWAIWQSPNLLSDITKEPPLCAALHNMRKSRHLCPRLNQIPLTSLWPNSSGRTLLPERRLPNLCQELMVMVKAHHQSHLLRDELKLHVARGVTFGVGFSFGLPFGGFCLACPLHVYMCMCMCMCMCVSLSMCAFAKIPVKETCVATHIFHFQLVSTLNAPNGRCNKETGFHGLTCCKIAGHLCTACHVRQHNLLKALQMQSKLRRCARVHSTGFQPHDLQLQQRSGAWLVEHVWLVERIMQRVELSGGKTMLRCLYPKIKKTRFQRDLPRMVEFCLLAPSSTTRRNPRIATPWRCLALGASYLPSNVLRNGPGTWPAQNASAAIRYLLVRTQLQFVTDRQSTHMVICGLTTFQREFSLHQFQ